MERDRSARIIATVAVLIALIGVSVGFAAFSQTLTIAGTANVQASKWEIKFENLRTVSLEGDATEETTPTIEADTSISEYSVNLVTPGDSATYTFDVHNNGTFDAKISDLVIAATPTCTGSGDNAANDQANVCEFVTYELTYNGTDKVAIDDTLEKGQTKTMMLKLKYSEDIPAEKLPQNDVALSNLGVTIVYSQN